MLSLSICEHRRDRWRNALLSAACPAKLPVFSDCRLSFCLPPRFLHLGQRTRNRFLCGKRSRFFRGVGSQGLEIAVFFVGPCGKTGRSFAASELFCNHCRMTLATARMRSASDRCAFLAVLTATCGWLVNFQRAYSCTVHVYMLFSRQCQGRKSAGARGDTDETGHEQTQRGG